ncbi:hypothetical protein BK133_21285 [Paenibacillus sp. FSL H8-0548]|uniref:hypothetical protein n=1 Tax=Paenibacillus sp. FSL H8-0548 TaxID=1920422 RepID=UPI00096C4388|nr:hypothetical protein [Paenibacillus sp. FSL H8-0548]OMF25627.1 hypothetical protein BK133_21285 [Paenibacillus sp. FSL H8-0548]
MTINFIEHRESITRNLIIFMRSKGYSKLSLSKQTNISRSEIDQILKSDRFNQSNYNSHIMKINESFHLPSDYFLEPQVTTVSPHANADVCSHDGVETQRSPEVQLLFDGLDNIFDIFSMYVKRV